MPVELDEEYGPAELGRAEMENKYQTSNGAEGWL